jgi:hypothetical protein
MGLLVLRAVRPLRAEHHAQVVRVLLLAPRVQVVQGPVPLEPRERVVLARVPHLAPRAVRLPVPRARAPVAEVVAAVLQRR